MNELKIFENPEFGKVRVIAQNGDPWFGASDVAKALGYRDTDSAVRAHCNYAKLSKPGDMPGLEIGPRGMCFIPESDMYALIFGSKLPQAVAFRAWVCEEVLPSIRKNGGYGTVALPNFSDPVEAACNAVPRLVEMVKYLSEKSRVETNGTNTWRIRESKTVLQEAYEATDPKRKTAAEDHSNTLTWTNEIPNVPGFYWMRSSLFPEPHIMNFSIEVIPLCADDFLPGIEFAGPIPEPTESRGHDGN